MYAENDPGLDRLGAAMDRRRKRRCVSFAPAAEASRPTLGLHEPTVLAVSAPERERSTTDISRAVYWGVRELLESRGARSEAASKVALRAARTAFLEYVGVESREATLALGVSGRQARRDRELLRALDRRDLCDSRAPLPRVPRPSDRVVVGLERVA